MFADVLNLIIAQKNMKKNWKIKGKIIYQKEIITKYRSLQTKERLQNKKGSRWKIATKAIYNILVLSFSLIIFLMRMRYEFKE